MNNNEELYFVIHNSCGDTIIKPYTKDKLLKDVLSSGGDYGNVEEFEFLTLEDIVNEANTNYWGENLLIIKGSVIIPNPVKVATKFEV